MALYDINSGNAAVASDVEQLVNIFNGKHDIGNISLAPQLSAPSSGSFTLATQSGSSLGIGTYNYQFTYVTGQYKSDGVTLVQTGETTVSAAKSITTTSGNTNILITLPTSSLPTSLIAINIYRTSVGGSDYKLIATVKAGSVNYTDSTSDSSRSATTPPSTNSTGTLLGASIPWTALTFQNGWINYGYQFERANYRLNSLGVVELKGRIGSGTTTSGTVIATLPAGLRPAYTHSFSVVTNNTSNDQIGQIDIDASGNILAILVYNTYTSLDGISFSIV